MKRLFILLTLAFVSLGCFAQRYEKQSKSGPGPFGVAAGITSSSVSIKYLDRSNIVGFHAGMAYRLDLTRHLSLQPMLLYNVKGTMEKCEGIKLLDTSVGFLELPVQLQWGINLPLARPYIFAEPFVGFGLNTKTRGVDRNWDIVHRLEYGLGLGAGVDVFSRFQVSARYFWNFGDLYDTDGHTAPVWDEIKTGLKGLINGQRTFSGIALSAVYFF